MTGIELCGTSDFNKKGKREETKMKPLDELIEQVGSYEALIELLYAICALTECGLDIDEMVERLDQIHSEYGIY